MQKRRQALCPTTSISSSVMFIFLSFVWAQDRGAGLKDQVAILTSDRVVTIKLKMPDNR